MDLHPTVVSLNITRRAFITEEGQVTLGKGKPAGLGHR